MTLSEEITSVAHAVGFSKIPPHTVERAKLFFIDTFGVALAGRDIKGNKEIAELVTTWGGKKEATILYSGERVPAQLAALVNSLMIHSTEYDDTYEAGGAHVNVSVIPSALAVAQRKGGVSGKELLTAIILGTDLVCRLGVSLPIHPGWHISSAYGIFGAALAAGKILGLTPEVLTSALGIAYSQAAGTRQGRLEGTLAKRLQPALACQSGVMAALIAEKGLTGPKEWIEGIWGMARVYTDSHEQIPEESLGKLKRGLGEVFLGDDLSFKLYPCCKVAHTSIEATLDLVEENHINSDEMDEVIVNVSPGAYKTVGSPFRIRTNPQVDAQFSIPYTVALALVRKKVNLDGFDEETIQDPEVTATAKRVRVMIDTEMKDVSSNMVNLASKVAIHTRRGIFSKELAICKGHPDRPIIEEDVFQKFYECCQYNKIFSDKEIENTLSLLRELEDLRDVDEIFSRVTWPAQRKR
jgi:2-methylcitrate dehydratase PrpD